MPPICMARVLAGNASQVMVVGDDDQSIYGWRGAKIENIQRFERDFSGATVFRLEQNYRSTATILQAANGLIEKNADRLGKALWTADGEGERIGLYAAYNEIDESRFIVARVQEGSLKVRRFQSTPCCIGRMLNRGSWKKVFTIANPLPNLWRSAIFRARGNSNGVGLYAATHIER